MISRLGVKRKESFSAGNDVRPAPDKIGHYCSKKGQEEIMGFILVVVMVMMIGLGFLFFFTPKAPERQDLEMQNLLYAWLSTTIEGKDVSSMIENCYGACDLSKETVILDNAIDAKFGRGASSLNGYSLNVTGTAEFYYSKGNLTGNYRTAFVPVKDNDVRLKFYLP